LFLLQTSRLLSVLVRVWLRVLPQARALRGSEPSLSQLPLSSGPAGYCASSLLTQPQLEDLVGLH